MRRWLGAALLAVGVAGAAAPALAVGGGKAEHGGAHGAHGVPGEVNWFYGVLGEKEGLDHPDLLWRPKGMPLPVGVMVLNTGVLFWLLYRFGARPVSESLKKRKADIMSGIDDAARMKAEAEGRLAEYEEKLARIDETVERLHREFREAAEAERQRVLAEASDRRARVEHDARLLMAQELNSAREQLVREVSAQVVEGARELLLKQTAAADQSRLAEEFLASLDNSPINSLGGRA